MSGKYRFYSKTEYFDSLIKLISKTGRGDRVAMASMSLDTSEPHVNKILEKLGVSDRTQAATFALQRGIVHLE